jgi:hypothetical protein
VVIKDLLLLFLQFREFVQIIRVSDIAFIIRYNDINVFQDLDITLTSCVTLGKLLYLTMSQFSQNEDNDGT